MMESNADMLPREPDRMDIAEARIVALGGRVQQCGEVLDDFPVTHRFTPGLYCREICMPAGSVVVSKIHRTEHPYVISQGCASVYIEGVGWTLLRAPHTGITKPGTRRLLIIHEDTIWSTFHPTELTDVAEIEAAIIEPHANPLLPATERLRLGEAA